MSEENKLSATFDTEITCPVCDQPFTITKVRSKHMRLEKKRP